MKNIMLIIQIVFSWLLYGGEIIEYKNIMIERVVLLGIIVLLTIIAIVFRIKYIKIKKKNKLYEESDYKFRAVFDMLPEKIFIKDMNLRYFLCNKKYSEYIGKEYKDILGKDDFQLHSEEKANEYREIDAAVINTKQTFRMQHEYFVNGEKKWHYTVKQPTVDSKGKVTGVLGILTDITEIKDVEEELIEAKSRAEEGNREKIRFIANMSHEIRTPLNGIVGMAELLKYSELNEEQREYVELLIYSSDRIIGVISDILDMSKIESGNFSLEDKEFVFNDIVSKSVKIFYPETSKKGVEFVSKFDNGLNIKVIGDSGRIGQIVFNLVGNAVKFTDKGQITVTSEKLFEDKESVRIKVSVKDTGIGIPVDKKEKVFERFYQADNSTTKKSKGTGLGLSISKSIIDIMKGEIDVESQEGKGSCFYFIITLKKA